MYFIVTESVQGSRFTAYGASRGDNILITEGNDEMSREITIVRNKTSREITIVRNITHSRSWLQLRYYGLGNDAFTVDYYGNRDVDNQMTIRHKRRTPMIYACATMWHETEQEMMQILKSIFRWGHLGVKVAISPFTYMD